MARLKNAVEAAAERISIIREIVNRERIRAEAKPEDQQNIEIGITEIGQTREEARTQITIVFDEISYLLDHLNVAHMAASFEQAAKARMATIVGEARSAVEKARKDKARWPANLVRGTKSFDGLNDIGSVMGLDCTMQAMFTAIRKVRNEFSHAPTLNVPPAVTGLDTQETLSAMLDHLK